MNKRQRKKQIKAVFNSVAFMKEREGDNLTMNATKLISANRAWYLKRYINQLNDPEKREGKYFFMYLPKKRGVYLIRFGDIAVNGGWRG